MLQIALLIWVLHQSAESTELREIVARNLFITGRHILYNPTYINYERLSVEESVGQIFLQRDGVVGGLQIDPAAKPSIRRIIRNPHLKGFHKAAITKLSLEGDADDVKVLSEYMESRRGKELGFFVPTTVFVVFRTLATMANRNVDGADALLRRMCDREYWKEFPLEDSAEWAYSDEVISSAVYNLARTNCEDLNDIIQKTIVETPAGTRREGMKVELSSNERIAECLIEFDWRIYPLIPASSRRRALFNFNGDLENPGPKNAEK